MLFLRRLRIPLSLLPLNFPAGAVDPVEPATGVDVEITGDQITALQPTGSAMPAAGARVIDLGGELALPAFIDGHVHLDKAHTWHRAPNRRGTFAAAAAALGADVPNWTAADLMRRAQFSLQSAYAHGTCLVRTHVDTGLPWAETSHAVMAELRALWRGRIELQTVPLFGIWDFATGVGEKACDLGLKYGATALGGFVVMSADLPGWLDRQLAIARDRGVGLDLHVDENGDPGSHCLRLVAEAVLRNRFSLPVVCGHACSLAVQAPDAQRATIDLVRAAGIRIISLPLCNAYLQDRRTSGFPRTPSWRGVTLIQDMQAAGITVACASDNVRDAFHAYGDFDPLEVYTASVRLAHLDSDLASSIGVVTSAAADCVGRPDLGRVAVGRPAQLVLTGARSFSELLSRPSLPRRRVDGETITTPAPPAYGELVEAGLPGSRPC